MLRAWPRESRRGQSTLVCARIPDLKFSTRYPYTNH
jgi:hypothetical protein